MILLLLFPIPTWSTEIAITIDDLTTNPTPPLTAKQRSQKILATLKNQDISATLFVCGKRIDNQKGKELLDLWDQNGHQIGNHTYSHHYYHSNEISLEDFVSDFIKGEKIISGLTHFTKIFRFPYLKRGNTLEKRNGFRDFLKNKDYQFGYVTIDASDWYIDQRMRKALSQNPKKDLTPYRNYYLNHMWDRANYYDGLAKRILRRDVKHTLLIHDNLLNALFLNDLIEMFRKQNWKIIDSKEAFKDPVFNRKPNILPAGESIIWALAKEAGEPDLRYPAEDGKYQEKEMDALGL